MSHYESVEVDRDLVLYSSNLCIVGILIEGVNQQASEEGRHESGERVTICQRPGGGEGEERSELVEESQSSHCLTWRGGSRGKLWGERRCHPA